MKTIEKRLLNIKEAAIYLNVSEPWLRKAIFEKSVPYIKIRRLVRFSRTELDLYIQNNIVRELGARND